MNIENSYFQRFETIFKSVNVGKQELKGITSSYNYFFKIAYKKDPQKCTQIIDSFFVSNKKVSKRINFVDAENLINKENKTKQDAERIEKIIVQASLLIGRYKDIADIQKYEYFVNRHNETEKYGSNIKRIPGYNSKTYWNMLIDDYQKIFEIDRKVLVRLVYIDKLITDPLFKDKNLYKKSACKLINILKKSDIKKFNKSGADWDLVLFPLDRQIRNAVSHLDFYYDDKLHIFLGEDTQGNIFVIYPEIVKDILLPSAINVARGFVAASLLFKLKDNQKLYEKALTILN